MHKVDPSDLMRRMVKEEFGQVRRHATLPREGRKSYAETNPDLVMLARELARPPEGFARGPSLRKVAAELAARGFTAA